MKILPDYFYNRGGTPAMLRFEKEMEITGAYAGGDLHEVSEEQAERVLPSFSRGDYNAWLDETKRLHRIRL